MRPPSLQERRELSPCRVAPAAPGRAKTVLVGVATSLSGLRAQKTLRRVAMASLWREHAASAVAARNAKSLDTALKLLRRGVQKTIVTFM
jgi:hypothetical protein